MRTAPSPGACSTTFWNKRKLSDKIMRFFGDQNRSRTLMRVAYRIISSDHSIEEEEMSEFRRLCFMLGTTETVGTICPAGF